MLTLATGQQMATFLKNKGVNLTKLTNAQIRNGNNGADLSGLTQTQRQALAEEHAALVLHPARGGAEQTESSRASGRASSRRPSTGRSRAAVLDRERHELCADARAQQHHLPDGGPAAVRVRGEEGAAGAERLRAVGDRGVGGRGACLRQRSRMRHAQRASIRNRRRHHPRVLRRLLERLRVRPCRFAWNSRSVRVRLLGLEVVLRVAHQRRRTFSPGRGSGRRPIGRTL